MTADTRSIIQSIIDSDNTFSGQIVADIPNMNSILKRLEPMALPSASPLSPFRVAVIEVTSSGSDVPIAIIVSPIKFSLTPKSLAIRQALSTTSVPPNITEI